MRHHRLRRLQLPVVVLHDQRRSDMRDAGHVLDCLQVLCLARVSSWPPRNHHNIALVGICTVLGGRQERSVSHAHVCLSAWIHMCERQVFNTDGGHNDDVHPVDLSPLCKPVQTTF
eukprot:TRINITY_DN34051_c0_g1_i1.p3 TRINITY_DN34051_c0_g1~~TRINITY_DN34051_c0_g1_i1.p3  ORF type:complete len:116 (-),score=6.38 TRINITY_DN34051_c0_g1_i1:121-468(-)